MTKTGFLIILILIAAIVAACGPATSTSVPAKPLVVEPSGTASSAPAAETIPTVSLAATGTFVPLSPTTSSNVQPVATSRGPNLEATDPTTVNLASGELQLVEFFRFT